MRDEVKSAIGIIIILAIVVFVLASCVGYFSNAISEEAAVARFKELAGTNDVRVIRHSNNTFLFGDPHDVTFELVVDGKPEGGRCISGDFSPMVCRRYGAGGE